MGWGERNGMKEIKFTDLPVRFYIALLYRTLTLYQNPRFCGYHDGKHWWAKCKNKNQLVEWYKEYVRHPNVLQSCNTYNKDRLIVQYPLTEKEAFKL